MQIYSLFIIYDNVFLYMIMLQISQTFYLHVLQFFISTNVQPQRLTQHVAILEVLKSQNL